MLEENVRDQDCVVLDYSHNLEVDDLEAHHHAPEQDDAPLLARGA